MVGYTKMGGAACLVILTTCLWKRTVFSVLSSEKIYKPLENVILSSSFSVPASTEMSHI